MMKKFTTMIRGLYEREVEKTDKVVKQIELPKEQISISMKDELKEAGEKLKNQDNKEKKNFLFEKEKMHKKLETVTSVNMDTKKEPKLNKKRLRD